MAERASESYQSLQRLAGTGAGAPGLSASRSSRRGWAYSHRCRISTGGCFIQKHHGFVMFEDLKEHWRQTFNLDYVLINSRTGHTSIGGFVHSGLPMPLVLPVFSNEQNLRGLDAVLKDLRATDGFKF